MVVRNKEGREWDVRKWKSEIDKVVKHVGLSEWKNKMEQKSTLEWYREKEVPMWSESRSEVYKMCDMGEDETVEHVVLECVKYARDRNEVMQMVLREFENIRVKMTGREWMVLLLGLCGNTNDRTIEAVKEFLERMWRARCVNQNGHFKGLTHEQSRVTCNIKIKIMLLQGSFTQQEHHTQQPQGKAGHPRSLLSASKAATCKAICRTSAETEDKTNPSKLAGTRAPEDQTVLQDQENWVDAESGEPATSKQPGLEHSGERGEAGCGQLLYPSFRPLCTDWLDRHEPITVGLSTCTAIHIQCPLPVSQQYHLTPTNNYQPHLCRRNTSLPPRKIVVLTIYCHCHHTFSNVVFIPPSPTTSLSLLTSLVQLRGWSLLAPQVSFLHNSPPAINVDDAPPLACGNVQLVGGGCESLQSSVWPSHIPSNSPASSEWCLVSYGACTASRGPTLHTGRTGAHLVPAGHGFPPEVFVRPVARSRGSLISSLLANGTLLCSYFIGGLSAVLEG
ncbi:hypothetical protein E2C01_028062 [Portunus trituberculatus]|uniref:Uncharacterized protein n=1 Tax=Portunus trituberculatus TaxID=210409 RepID=A0A5B7EMM3_PORTR|nr:hypothetical protein [Portunus trituberculatus]